MAKRKHYSKEDRMALMQSLRGKSRKQIARSAGVSENTVRRWEEEMRTKRKSPSAAAPITPQNGEPITVLVRSNEGGMEIFDAVVDYQAHGLLVLHEPK